MSRLPVLRRSVVLALLLWLPLLAPPSARAEDDVATEIAWVTDLPEAFAKARADDRPLMICINARRVGIGRVEPAAKELRTKTYKDERVVKLARESFVCAFLTARGSSEDYGELRVRYGIDGDIVSPQHIFAYPDGTLIQRKEYWPYGTGDSSVKALLEMMEKALARDRYRRGVVGEEGEERAGTTPPVTPEGDAPVEPGDVGDAPAAGPQREAWIQKQIQLVKGRDDEVRRVALEQLATADREGDCVRALLAALAELEANPFACIDIVRALGRPGLVEAAPPLVDLLKDDNEELRANTAVSLEYIGSADVWGDLQRRAGREKNPKVETDLWRAVGRCGAGDSKARAALVKAASKAKDYTNSFGPIIGLAYFPGDAKAARAVEKMLVKVGPPRGGRRVRADQSLHRALLVWCLCEIGDEKSADFIMERLIEPLENIDSRWKPRIMRFYSAAVKVCRGDREQMGDVLEGVTYYVGRVEDNPMLDDARQGRDGGAFVPKGEF